ncbi:hypothetical protein [Dactylosporangium sp. CS-033363]|uniref:hypothetical protein n=1 Tax=Dactylosporangium sp. CS-033363 TaxID=3239935 RepID=UPI003D8D3226
MDHELTPASRALLAHLRERFPDRPVDVLAPIRGRMDLRQHTIVGRKLRDAAVECVPGGIRAKATKSSGER